MPRHSNLRSVQRAAYDRSPGPSGSRLLPWILPMLLLPMLIALCRREPAEVSEKTAPAAVSDDPTATPEPLRIGIARGGQISIGTTASVPENEIAAAVTEYVQSARRAGVEPSVILHLPDGSDPVSAIPLARSLRAAGVSELTLAIGSPENADENPQ